MVLGTHRPKTFKYPEPPLAQEAGHDPSIGFLSVTNIDVVLVLCRLLLNTVKHTVTGMHKIAIDHIEFLPLDKLQIAERMIYHQKAWALEAYYCDELDYAFFNDSAMHRYYLNLYNQERVWISITPLERHVDLMQRHIVNYISWLDKGFYILNPALLNNVRIKEELYRTGSKGLVDAISGATEVLHQRV